MKKTITTILAAITAICFIATLVLLFTGTVAAVYTLPLVFLGIICCFAGLYISEHDDPTADPQPMEA